MLTKFCCRMLMASKVGCLDFNLWLIDINLRLLVYRKSNLLMKFLDISEALLYINVVDVLLVEVVFCWLLTTIYLLHRYSSTLPWRLQPVRFILIIPSPKLILGDFIAKHSLWGSPDNDPSGVAIFNDILNNNLCVLK